VTARMAALGAEVAAGRAEPASAAAEILARIDAG